VITSKLKERKEPEESKERLEVNKIANKGFQERQASGKNRRVTG
jgi:hypothetical protein